MTEYQDAWEDTFRKEYHPLDEERKNKINLIKSKAEELLVELEFIDNDNKILVNKRCITQAKINLEMSIMWAVKSIT